MNHPITNYREAIDRVALTLLREAGFKPPKFP